MTSKDGLNAISTSKMTSSRKRKRRKWKSSNFADSRNSPSSFVCERNHNSEMVPHWYWSNYFKALEWQNKHKVALWKSFALGLQQENRNLLLELQKRCPDRVFNAPLTVQNLEESDKIPCGGLDVLNDTEDEVEMEGNNSRNGEIEFEMSEEMFKFFEKSIKHKLEMKRLKEEESDCIDVEVKEFQEVHHEREQEMQLLYGDGSSMIIGMETAVQLSFDKYCDLKSPSYWPNIPFNI